MLNLIGCVVSSVDAAIEEIMEIPTRVVKTKIYDGIIIYQHKIIFAESPIYLEQYRFARIYKHFQDLKSFIQEVYGTEETIQQWKDKYDCKKIVVENPKLMEAAKEFFEDNKIEYREETENICPYVRTKDLRFIKVEYCYSPKEHYTCYKSFNSLFDLIGFLQSYFQKEVKTWVIIPTQRRDIQEKIEYAKQLSWGAMFESLR